MTKEVITIAHNRAIYEEEEFNEEEERCRLSELLHLEYARSVYGSAPSFFSSQGESDHHSMTSSMSAKRPDTAAKLAAKKAN